MLRKITTTRIFWLVAGGNLCFAVLYRFWFRSLLLGQLVLKPDPLDRAYYAEIFASLDLCALAFLFFTVLGYCLRKTLARLIARSNEKMVLVSCLTFLVIIQLWLIFFVRTIPIADSSFYVALSERLFSTGSYISVSGALTAFWPVGLPAYLCFLKTICGDFVLPAKIMNIAISVATVLILFSLAKNEMSKNGFVIFVLLSALYPNNVFSATVIMPDYVFSMLLWTLVLVAYKIDLNYYTAVVQGGVMAVMCYLRPVGLLLPLIFITYYFRFGTAQKQAIKIAVMIVVFVVSLSPWIYRNAEAFHALVPVSTNGGYNFLMGNHHGSSGGVNFDFPYNFSEPNESLENAEAYSRGFKEIIGHPLASLVRLPKKLFHSYYRGDSSVTWSLKQTENVLSPFFRSASFFLANQIFYIVVGLSLLGMMTNNSRHGHQGVLVNPNLSFLLWSVYIYSIAVILAYVGTERYIIPVMPIHFFFFAIYLSSLCPSNSPCD